MSSEQAKKRDRNRYTILSAIQSQGPLKRTELATKYSIRKSSVTSLVDELITREILCNKIAERPRSPMTFTSGKWFAVAVSVFVEEIHFGRIDLTGKIYDKLTLPLKGESQKELLEIISDGIGRMLKINPSRSLGIGIAVPGIVNSNDGICNYAINMPQLRDAKIGAYIKSKFNQSVMVENDVRASLWAGIWFERFLSNYRNVIYLDITSGISSALLVNGQRHVGATFSAGELGHMKAGDENRSCRCGKVDCLETYCSIEAICRDIHAIAPELGNLKSAVDIVDAAKDNVVVMNVLDRAMERLCRLLSVLVAYVDPDVILLGNQDPRFYELVLPMLKKHLLTQLQGCSSGEVDMHIVPSAMDSALRGVAGLVIDNAFKFNFHAE
ncbi:ROK family protein [Verrucomicrobiota bacterium]